MFHSSALHLFSRAKRTLSLLNCRRITGKISLLRKFHRLYSTQNFCTAAMSEWLFRSKQSFYLWKYYWTVQLPTHPAMHYLAYMCTESVQPYIWMHKSVHALHSTEVCRKWVVTSFFFNLISTCDISKWRYNKDFKFTS